MSITNESGLTPAQRWAALKASGPTIATIDVIDKDTPWQEVAPLWWIDMMDVRRSLQTQLNQGAKV